jgi:hypothetical protein
MTLRQFFDNFSIMVSSGYVASRENAKNKE